MSSCICIARMAASPSPKSGLLLPSVKVSHDLDAVGSAAGAAAGRLDAGGVLGDAMGDRHARCRGLADMAMVGISGSYHAERGHSGGGERLADDRGGCRLARGGDALLSHPAGR